MNKSTQITECGAWFDKMLTVRQASKKSKESTDYGRKFEAAAVEAYVRKSELSFASLVRNDPTNEKVRCLMNALASRGCIQACSEHPYWKDLGITCWMRVDGARDQDVATAMMDLVLETYRKEDEARLRGEGHTGFVPNKGEDGSVPWNREFGWH